MPLIKKNIGKLNESLSDQTMINLNCNKISYSKMIDISAQPLTTVEYKKMTLLKDTLVNKINNIDQSNQTISENYRNLQIVDQTNTEGETETDKNNIFIFKTVSRTNRRSAGRSGGPGRGGGRGRGRGRGRGQGRGRGFKRGRYKNKKKSPALPKGVLKIQSTFNNTIITISNLKGNVIGWSSSGTNGFKGSRKSTAFAAKTTAKDAAKKSVDQGLKRAKVLVKGVGPGRENALRSLSETELEIALIRDVTGLPHNGCRPRKKRRI